MGIFIEAIVRGEEEAKASMLANSGSDLVVLTKDLAEKVKPKSTGLKIEMIKVGGERENHELFEIEVEVEDPETKERRKEKVHAIISEHQDVPLLGYEAMEKLGILLDIKRGKYRLI